MKPRVLAKRKEVINTERKKLAAFLLLAIVFAATNCEHRNTISSNENSKLDITWQQTRLDSLEITSLAVNQFDTVLLAAACNEPFFRFKDNGITWTRLSTNFCINTLVANSAGDFYGAIRPIVMRTTDNGNSWIFSSLQKSLGFDNNVRSIAFKSDSVVFVGSTRSDEWLGGVYYSSDYGATWEKTSLPDSLSVYTIAIDNQNRIFAGTNIGIYRSADDGTSWENLTSNLVDISSRLFVNAIVINPQNSFVFAAVGNNGIYRSKNGGQTWEHIGIPNIEVEIIIINSKGYLFAGDNGAFGSSGGVYYSSDTGETWVQINEGLINTKILSLALDHSGYLYAGTEGSGVFRAKIFKVE